MVDSKLATVLGLLLTFVSIDAAPQLKSSYQSAVGYQQLPERNDRDRYEVVVNGGQPKGNRRSATDGDEETLEDIQAKSAQYSYGSSINDSISDQTITRQETRDGLALKGMYSYSDGYFKRTVHYEADDKGYRVVKEINVPIGDGPQVDPNGTADVSSSLSGSYSITADDIAKPLKKISVDRERARNV